MGPLRWAERAAVAAVATAKTFAKRATLQYLEIKSLGPGPASREYGRGRTQELRRTLFPLLFGLVVLANANANAAGAVDDVSFDAFFGQWQGNAVAEEPPGAFFGFTSRDLDIVIGPKGAGFNLSWTTIIYPEDEGEEVRRRNASIDFLPSDKAGVFRAAGLEDPHGEGGYVWARIEGQTMRVNSLTIDARGRYTLQVYKRTLTGGGMELDFVSIQEDEPLRTVKGRLIKVAN